MHRSVDSKAIYASSAPVQSRESVWKLLQAADQKDRLIRPVNFIKREINFSFHLVRAPWTAGRSKSDRETDAWIGRKTTP